ncbi:hypothetical protein EDC54_104214 [Samsonia erythrinae]|uniref:Uncharacterized protein n=1 Tax=Samsonia erythrinae TaxID=160434 RepID=A0A4R3VPX6_9GAMM|nr:hypothetical protein EDC54_104214 [Samsonia erythrinae]
MRIEERLIQEDYLQADFLFKVDQVKPDSIEDKLDSMHQSK